MDELLGTIKQFGFNYEPEGWIICHGQVLRLSENQALYSLLGDIYGGDGRTTFALPDLRKKKDGVPYKLGEIMSDGLPFIESYICVEGLYPPRK
jgi:microcystin-dependent protein